MEQKPVPPRPGPWQEKFAKGLFLALSPRLPRTPQPDPPEQLAPFEALAVPRPGAGGPLTATWFPAARPRGAVLLLHPWMVWGKAYFHLRGRIQALRAAGYHALALDLAGFGGSGPADGFFDRDVEAGLEFLRQRAGGRLPVHVWGVSAGGYWAHPVLARTAWVAGAMFEDVSPHLFEWSWRTSPLYRPAFLFYRCCLRTSYRFLDIRSHARAMSLKAVTYVSGELDRGVRPEDTRALAEAAGGRWHVVPRADHLGAIQLAGSKVLFLALETFMSAERSPPGPDPLREGQEDRTEEAMPIRFPGAAASARRAAKSGERERRSLDRDTIRGS